MITLPNLLKPCIICIEVESVNETEMANATELKKAYETLGLPEDASKEDVENRYFLLLKKDRARQRNPEAEYKDLPPLADINAAYKVIMNQEIEKAKQQYNEAKYGKSKHKEKIDHFFHYYRIHLLVAIVLIAAIGYGIKAYMDKKEAERLEALLPPPSLHVMLFGDYIAEDPGELESNILQAVPGWERLKIDVTPVPEEVRSEFDFALQQKSMLALVTIRPDIYILDKVNFDKLLNQGAFRKLDDLKQRLGEQLPTDIELHAQTEEDTQKHLYGIDLSGHSIFEQTPFAGKETIAVIREGAELLDNAFTFIETVVKVE